MPPQQAQMSRTEIVCTAQARTGIVGNPSDQFEGKTVSATLSNFQAQVRDLNGMQRLFLLLLLHSAAVAKVKLVPSERVVFVPNPELDPLEFSSLDTLSTQLRSKGYYGGIRLLKVSEMWAVVDQGREGSCLLQQWVVCRQSAGCSTSIAGTMAFDWRTRILP